MSDEAENPVEQPARPKTFQEAVKLTQQAAKEVDTEEDDGVDQGEEEVGDEDPTDNSWAVLPEWVRVPPGKQVSFIRFRSHLTERPELGDRVAIVWGLSVADERVAIKRSRGDAARMLPEQSMQMIRSIDGLIPDWSGRPEQGKAYSVTKFFDEIGPKYRQMVENIYIKQHGFTEEERLDFFLHCLVIRTAVAGG